MNPTIAAAVSGGVDSLVAAHLLKQDDPRVVLVHFRTGFELDPVERTLARIQSIGAQLDLPVHVLDLSTDFRREVVDYFAATYLAGQTPNPCVVCNPAIKFGALLRRAEAFGATRLATGHYAEVRRDPSGRCRLFKGIDVLKDQSYFLARLTQDQLARARFPLAGLTKAAVREIAAAEGLVPVTSEESQDVCFIKAGAYHEFIAELTGRPAEAGLIETTDGTVVGRHPGLQAFTVGQRRGINCPAAEPYYVVRLDRERNRLVVGHKNEILTAQCRVTRINWIAPPPGAALRVAARVRYRTPETPATVVPIDADSAWLRFDAPQPAVTPGQAAVFYDGIEVLGGGFIAQQQDAGCEIRDTG
jgi:tRNA-specific 2-thiouridylase